MRQRAAGLHDDGGHSKARRSGLWLGGKIEYVAFDEPMVWGRVTRGAHACGYSIEEVVSNIAPNIRILKTAFPGVKFGDIEPVSDKTMVSDRLNDLMDFVELFQQQTGERLSFLQADIIWQTKWRPQLVEWRKAPSGRNVLWRDHRR